MKFVLTDEQKNEVINRYLQNKTGGWGAVFDAFTHYVNNFLSNQPASGDIVEILERHYKNALTLQAQFRQDADFEEVQRYADRAGGLIAVLNEVGNIKPTVKRIRKPTAVSASFDITTVLCNDGAVLVHDRRDASKQKKGWVQLPPIPQPFQR